MKIVEGKEIPKIKAIEVPYGEVCKIKDTIAIVICYDEGSFEDNQYLDFIRDNFLYDCCNFDHNKDYDEYVAFVNLESGDLFFVHRDTPVIRLSNAVLKID